MGTRAHSLGVPEIANFRSAFPNTQTRQASILDLPKKMKRNALWLNSADNVASALCDLSAGAEIRLEYGTEDRRSITLLEAIPLGHKFAIAPIAANADIIKYGMTIGPASQDIAIGQHVHLHNVVDSDDDSVLHEQINHPTKEI